MVRTVLGALDRRRARRGGGSYTELIEFVPDRPGHDRRYALDAGKIAHELGWRPEADFERAIEDTVTWYLDNEAWWRAILADSYDGRRLGLGEAGGKQAGAAGGKVAGAAGA